MDTVGFIWDIDGVVVDSPHEEAWRITAMKSPWNADSLTSDFYFAHVASRPRYEGGNNILKLKGIYERLGARTEEEKKRILEQYCEEKNTLIKQLINEGKFKLFHDAVTQLLKAKKLGILQAAASASKNAKPMLMKVSKSRITDELKDNYGVLKDKDTLYSVFDIDVCGLDLGGKQNILKFAAEQLKTLSGGKIKKFVVFEDAPSGIEAAKSLGFYAVGVFRIGEKESLTKAGADIVTEDLRKIDIGKLISADSNR
ncbi:MAG: hypothetical protein JW983_09070 [Elusimicrobia bacterium]|nr:hypothetical protein [Elusimicrobiota bacterium]